MLNKAFGIGDFRTEIYNTTTTDTSCKQKNKKAQVSHFFSY
jgi:hypothetical protein